LRIIRYLDDANTVGYASEQADGRALKIKGDIFGEFEITQEVAQIKKLLAPIVSPMIWCIGANYRRHIEESGAPVPEYPVLFAKSPTALQNPGDPIHIPAHLKSDEVDFECELAVVIGRACKNVSRERALDYVLGYTCANDVSARDWQLKRGGSQWCRGKTFDTFAPLGPCLVTKEDIPNPNSLRIRTVLNGETMQDWNTNDMIFDIPALIEFLAGSTTLSPGTVIMTGTPHGVGMARSPPVWLKAGDEVSIVIERIGVLTNPVEEESDLGSCQPLR
jgi:2-keto-4-pentenoate hydratase/2-oxohepta-3-ene-1,7-dioic acid hydratase in catechol pathway